MQYLNTKYFKTLSFTLLAMVIGSLTAWAGLPLQMLNNFSSCLDTMTETQALLITSDGILWTGFLLWVGYVVFFFPKDALKNS